MNIKGRFYPVTPEVAKVLRQAKLTAAEWRIWSYLIEIEPWGDAYEDIDTLGVMTECKVSKATYYRAIAKFQELELFDFQDKGFSIRNLKGVSSLKNETTVSEMRQDSQKCESSLKNETTVSEMRQDSQKCEKQRPKPSQSKDSNSPKTIQTLSDYTDSLSDSERESFLKFGLEKAKRLPHPPELPYKWVEAHWQEISAEWMKIQGKIPEIQQQKWENHPYRHEWIEKIRSLGQFGFYAENRQEEKERREFFKWADTNDLIWGQQ
ncbi:hypothetical protein [Anabaena sp. PCC 7108]|uniref:hypothetical protein n=1 Tax=Anabaena sp. PCC 7108 TaxID=163908 RepID=UPI000346FB28|nr:hypothetical protein [Anabaena sp. PCC 7108]